MYKADEYAIIVLKFGKEGIYVHSAKEIGQLMLEFMRFGCFTFGGGWSIISQMQELYVEKKKTITAEELLDLVSVAKSLPGTMIGNVAMLFGYRCAGLLGGFVCVFGMCAPPMVVLIIISYGYAAFRSNFWVSSAMEGIQAAVAPIIASAALGLTKGSVKYPPCVIVLVASFAMYLFFDVSAIWLVVLGLVSGFLIGEYYERKEARDNGAA